MIITFAALTTLYFGFAFIAFCHDRITARAITQVVEPQKQIEIRKPQPRKIFRPMPVVAKAGLYQQCSIRQLKSLAKGRNVKAWSRLTKTQLVEALG